MTKLETYSEKAAASLAASTAATTSRERSFHHRAYCIWRRLAADVETAANNPDASSDRPVKSR
jgi:hypothetical protein